MVQKGARVKVDERRSRIAEQVRREGTASIEDLAGQFGVTEQTIRRDVNTLCDEGILLRRYGGVTLPPQVERLSNKNLPYDLRQVLHLDAKRAIARLVAESVPDGASLFFSVGTTPELVAWALDHHRGLRVFTNNLSVALACCANPETEVSIVGGRIRTRYRDVVGPAVQDFFATYTVDIGIFGAGGIATDGTLLDFDEEEVVARQAIAANSRRSFLIADHSKFGRNAIVGRGHLSDVDDFFTDRPPTEPLAELLREAGVGVHWPGAAAGPEQRSEVAAR